MRRMFQFCALSLLLASIVTAVCMADDSAEVKSRAVKDVYPALTTGVLANTKMVSLPVGVLLQSGNTKILQKNLDAEINKAPVAIKAQLKKNSFFLLEQMATRDLLTAEAKSWAAKNKKKLDDKSPALLNSYFDSLTAKVAVTDADVKDFFEKNKDMVGGATFDQIKDQLKDYVLNEKRQAFVDNYISSMGTRTVINVSESWVTKQYPLSMDNPVDKARTSGKPSIVDFGAEGCGPCDMMTPILAELKSEYADRANVVFVPVREEQILGARYGIQSIPVQVFFDKEGKEVFRHTGFFAKDQIIAKFAEMGVK